MVPIHSRLREARLEAGLSQQSLAERVGVRQPHVARWESGALPRVDTAVQLASALSTTVETLWQPSEPPSPLVVESQSPRRESERARRRREWNERHHPAKTAPEQTTKRGRAAQTAGPVTATEVPDAIERPYPANRREKR